MQVSIFFIRLLTLLLPLGMFNEFAKLDAFGVWLTILFSVIFEWMFTSLGQVGENTANPFEGGANDVPITAINRNIQID